MTLALQSNALATTASVAPKPVTLAPPGLFERGMVILTTFIFLHRTPLTWFSTVEELKVASNPVVVLLELALIGLAFMRVAGSIDYLINMVKLEPLIYLFSFLALISIFWTADLFETAKNGIILVALTAYASYLVMRFALDQILRLLAWMFTFSALLNTAFIVAVPQFGVDSGGLFTGVFQQKNILGYCAALAIPVLLVAGWHHRRLRLVFYPALLIHLGLLIGSESRTMLVAAMAPTLLMFVYQTFRGRKTLRGAVFMSLGGSGAFAVAYATANIGVLAGYLGKDVSLTGRIPMWEALVPIALERPWIGYGFGAAFGGYFSPVHELWVQARWNPSHAHNAPLQIMLEVGLIGVAIYLVLYVRAVLRGITIVAAVPGPVGLWPLTFLTTVLMMSITEAGVTSESLGWMMFVVATLSISFHLSYRTSMGYSNDLRAITAGDDGPITTTTTLTPDLIGGDDSAELIPAGGHSTHS
ncbi:MAG: O-antigen ligase family protein [Actinomycetota bacterium]